MKIKFFFWENWKKLFLPEMANFSAFNWHGNKFPTLPKLSEKSKNYYLIKMVSKWKRPLKKGLVLIFDFWYFKLLMPINLALDYSPGNLTHLFQVYGHGTKLKIIVKILLKCPLPPSSLYCKVPEPKSPRSCKIAIEYVKFWFWPINVWPHPVSCQKKAQIGQKVILFFFQEGGEEIGWGGCGWVYLLSNQIAGQGSEGQTSVGRSWNLLFSRNCFVFKPWNWQKLHFFQTSNFNILCFNSEVWIIGRHVIL